MKKVLDGLARAIMLVDIVMVFALTAICFLAVLDRYVLQIGIGWTVEICRLLLIWISFLAAVVAAHRKIHFVVDYFVDNFMPKGCRRAWNLLVLALCLGLSVMLTYKGVELCEIMHFSFSASLELPMSYFYGSLPVSFGLISLMLLVQLLEELGKSFNPKPASHPAG